MYFCKVTAVAGSGDLRAWLWAGLAVLAKP
jgi:hypothetical protein